LGAATTLLVLYVLKEAFEYLLRYANFRHMKQCGSTVPSGFEGEIDEHLLEKAIAYEREKTRFGFVASLFGNVVAILFIYGGVLDAYNSWIVSLDWPFIPAGIAFFLLLSFANAILTSPFDLYRTFKIENAFGFNTATPRLWVKDFVKSQLLSAIIIALVAAVGFWIVTVSPSFWWFWVWVSFVIFSLFMMYISPYVIDPLFNTFTPIEDQELVCRIRLLLGKVGITVRRVFKMDASKRSRHTNAYFSGIGKVKRIVLYDTLLESMDRDQILAVLAHEAGHWKRKHVAKIFVAAQAVSFFAFYAGFRILQTDVLGEWFEVRHETFFAKLVLIGFIGGIVSLPVVPLSNYLSRKFEREADRVAVSMTGDKNAMIGALVKLSKDNLANLHPHPLYAAFYYSHPSVVRRIEHIRKLEGDGGTQIG